ncbi:hypothetical protein B0H13DRAFT_1911969 [Mycena leptocephala]|nr:hypothetical protein B0H13DRAFT_1911969 [Mycena leptocephala]
MCGTGLEKIDHSLRHSSTFTACTLYPGGAAAGQKLDLDEARTARRTNLAGVFIEGLCFKEREQLAQDCFRSSKVFSHRNRCYLNFCHPTADAEALTKRSNRKGSELVSLSNNPVNSVWAETRPDAGVKLMRVFFAG